MALLRAADFLKDELMVQEFPLDFLEVPEGEPVPVLTIKVTDKIRDRAAKAEEEFAGIRMHGMDTGDQYVTVNNNPVGYCLAILEKAYQDCTDLFDSPSKLALLKLLRRQPAIAKALASMLMEFFRGDALLRKETDENDKKNSDDQ